MEKFYVMVNGQQQGPFTKEEIISKGFSKETYIYNKNLGGWKKISEISEFSSIAETKLKDISPKESNQNSKGKEEKNKNTDLTDKQTNVNTLESRKNSITKSLINLFKPSNFSKAHTELKENNLGPQAMLLKQAKKSGYKINNESHRDLEIQMLVLQKVNLMAALTSLARFSQAKQICKDNNLEKAANFFNFYIDLYNYYINNFNNLKET